MRAVIMRILLNLEKVWAVLHMLMKIRNILKLNQLWLEIKVKMVFVAVIAVEDLISVQWLILMKYQASKEKYLEQKYGPCPKKTPDYNSRKANPCYCLKFLYKCCLGIF